MSAHKFFAWMRGFFVFRITVLEAELAKKDEDLNRWTQWRDSLAPWSSRPLEPPAAAPMASSTPAGAAATAGRTAGTGAAATSTGMEERLRGVSDSRMEGPEVDADERTGIDARASLGRAFSESAREEAGFDTGSGVARRGGDLNRTKVQILAQASKVIKTKIDNSEEIISFLDKCTTLQNNILDLYGDESNQTRILIAMNQMTNTVRTDAEGVYEKCRLAGVYCFEKFFKDLFTTCHPAPQSTLDLNFRGLTQNNPVKGSIVDYGRRFRVMVNLLNYNLESHIYKFVSGLASSELKAALRRQNLEKLKFAELVALAVSISNNLSQEKTTEKLFSGVEEKRGTDRRKRLWESDGEGEDSEDEILKIMGVPLKEYLQKVTLHKLSNRCFNCFGYHRVEKCMGPKKCKFCGKGTGEAKHYSIICPKAPKDFKTFLEAREKAGGEFKKRDEEKVKFTTEFADYEFDSDEFLE